MCSRYSIASKLENIEKKFHAHFNYKYEPVYNAAPSLKLPIITQEDPHAIKAFQWGFVPHWETNINNGYINARGEGIHTSKAFMKSIRERWCWERLANELIPLNTNSTIISYCYN